MKEQARQLVKATQTLVAYIQENHVYDKLADGGCGLYDTYRSDPFDEAINNAGWRSRRWKRRWQRPVNSWGPGTEFWTSPQWA